MKNRQKQTCSHKKVLLNSRAGELYRHKIEKTAEHLAVSLSYIINFVQLLFLDFSQKLLLMPVHQME